MDTTELLADIAVGLVGRGSFDGRMNQVLEKIGRYLGLSRTYVFLDRPGNLITDNTHEWCANGIGPQREELQGIIYGTIPSWRSLLEQDGRILCSDISSLASDIRVVLEPQGIQSILVLPLYINNVISGFIGFDECTIKRGWKVEELSMLRVVSGILATVIERDMDSKRVETSEANFRRLFDTIDDIILVAKPDGDIVFSNKAVHDKLGYSSKELAGMRLIDLHPEDKREEAREIVEAMIRKERDTCPLELRRKDGNLLPVETRVWFGHWNGKDCIFGISKDLSAEQERLQMFSRLFEENPAPMALSDMKSNHFLEVNTAFLERLGYAREELIGRTSAELGLFVHPAQQRHVAEELASLGRVKNAELQVRRKDGKVLDGLFSGGILASQGSRRFLTVMTDISERKEQVFTVNNEPAT